MSFCITSIFSITYYLFNDSIECTLSYPSRLRMPKTYEQLVKDHQAIVSNKTSQLPTTTSCVLDDYSNEIELINEDDCSVGSGATEGPEMEHRIEMEKDDLEFFGTGHDETIVSTKSTKYFRN